MASAADKLKKTSNGGIPVVATVQVARSPGITALTVDTQQFWPITTGVAFSTYEEDTNHKKIPNTQIDWVAVSNGTTGISGMVRTGGAADTGNKVGDKVQMGPTADWAQGLIDAILAQHTEDGAHKDITATSVTVTGAVAAGSVAVSGAISGASAAVSGKGSYGLLQVAAGTTASVDGSGNITPANQVYDVTALAADAAIQVPSFTAWNGAALILRIFGAASHGLTFAAGYTNISGLDLPTATAAGKWHTIGALYSSTATKWQIVSISQES